MPLTGTGEAIRLNGRGWSTSMAPTALAPVSYKGLPQQHRVLGQADEVPRQRHEPAAQEHPQRPPALLGRKGEREDQKRQQRDNQRARDAAVDFDLDLLARMSARPVA